MICPQTLAQLRPSVAKRSRWSYGAPVTVKAVEVTVSPVAGFGDPIQQTALQRSMTIAGAFFVPAVRLYGGCAWETERSAGSRLPRFANLRTVASNDRLATVGGGSNQANGAVPMTKKRHILTLNPLKARAAAHRAMALAALRADSSLSVRLKRFNAQMAMARALEAQAMEFRRKTDATDTAIELRRSSTKREG